MNELRKLLSLLMLSCLICPVCQREGRESFIPIAGWSIPAVFVGALEYIDSTGLYHPAQEVDVLDATCDTWCSRGHHLHLTKKAHSTSDIEVQEESEYKRIDGELHRQIERKLHELPHVEHWASPILPPVLVP